MEHYYTKTPTAAHELRRIHVHWHGLNAEFDTDAATFSRDALDAGSRLLLDALLALNPAGRALDLGCGWGALGVLLKLHWGESLDVTMLDVNQRALGLAKANAALNHVRAQTLESDGFANVPPAAEFDWIISNPPIRVGKPVIYQMWADALAHLSAAGRLVIVIRKQQGAPSALKYLRELYGSAEVVERSGGYWIIEARSPDRA